jgi:hypothetical protein
MPSYSRQVSVPGKSAQELYDKVSTEIERFLAKMSIGKMDLDRDPENKKVKVKSSMFTVTLSCKDSSLELDGSISLMALPFKSKIDEGIDRWVVKTFGAPTA